MATAFTPFLNGEAPCHKVLEDERHLAFMEPSPVVPGHVVVLPKREVDHFFELEDADLAALVLFAKRVAVAMRAAIPCKKIAVIVYGMAVRHAHIHLLPAQGDPRELYLTNARRADDAELAANARRVRDRL